MKILFVKEQLIKKVILLRISLVQGVNSKDKISAKIDKLNNEIQKKDEKKRQEIIRKNREIIKDPQKLITEKLININDPKNFPDPLPQLSDDDLREIGCTTCSICPGEIEHRDPENPGCKGDKDTLNVNLTLLATTSNMYLKG